MRRKTIRVLLANCCSILSLSLAAQSGYNTGLNHSVINLPCGHNCLDIPVQIPHLKAASDYVVSSIPYKPYDYVTPGGNEVASIYEDDVYSAVIDMPFTFCFYDSVYNQLVIGSNGVVSFETANAGCINSYAVPQPIPYHFGTICADMTIYYPRAAIMGVYTDLDLRLIASPPDRKVEWRVEGTAPFRRMIVSFYHVGVFGNTCGIGTPITFQMVIYETSGIIEVYIEQKQCSPVSTFGKAILGVQNWDKFFGVAAPGKNSTVWSATNEAYQFLPSGNAVSRFEKSQILAMDDTFLAAGDASSSTDNLLDIKFPAFCPPAPTGQYIIKTIFSGCDNAANQIIVRDTITINKTNNLNAIVNATATGCGLAGSGTATITIPAGVGTAPYTFILNPGNITKVSAGNGLFTGLTAGNYTVDVSDASGTCSQPVPFTVTSTGILNISFTATNTTCEGATNGRVEIDPPTGTPPLAYSIDGVNFTASNVFNNLAAGLYSINVRDNAGCAATNIPVTIDQGPPLTMTTIATPTSCPGLSNGTITVTGSTGTAPFTYSINGGPLQASPTFTGLAPATYLLTLRDAAGCTVNPFHQQTVIQGTSTVTGTVASMPTSCNGMNNGTVTVTPTSGTGPYDYSINNGVNWQTNNIFNGLPPGVYNILIREGGACMSNNIPATITVGPPLTGTVVANSTACAGVNNGSITIIPDAAFTGPFEYALDGNAFQPSNLFTGVAAGNHTVVFRNTSGCNSAPLPVQILAGLALTGSTTVTAATCNGAADGVITIIADNGSAPYQYSLDGGPPQASAVFNAVTAGSHNVTITDAFGCTSSPITATINQPALLTAPVPLTTPVICNGTNTGKIIASPTGGTYPYAYSFDNINFQPDSIFNVVSGIYTIYVRDAHGCRIQLNNINITEPAPLTAVVSGRGNATCTGGNDGNIQIAANGGTVPYSYSVDGTNFQAASQLNVKAGTYDVTIKDAGNCKYVIYGVVVGVTDNLTLAVAAPPPICEGKSVQLTATGNATSFSWSPASAGIVNTTVSDPIASPVITTTYTVTATLGNCVRPFDVVVTVLPAPVADAGPPADICFGQNAQLQGTGGLTYTWTPSTYLDNNAIPDPQVIRPAATIIYSLSVTDVNNCSSLKPGKVTVNVVPPVKINISPVDTVVQSGSQFQILATSIGTTYTWSPVTGLSDPSIASPVVTAGADGSEVLYKVQTRTDAGCEGEGYVRVRVYKGPDIYVPTAFTPNHDGKNDLFYPFAVGIKQLKYFRVFNRWGQLLFATSTLQQGWDGKMADKEQGSGVYIWTVQGITQDGKVINKTGTVTLIR